MTLVNHGYSFISGQLFFNIIINDLFLFANKSEIRNYADDNTLPC